VNDLEKIVIATTTMYKDINETRARLAIETVKEARKLNYDIVVVDSSSDIKIKEDFSNWGAILLDQNYPGMGKGRRQAIGEAASIAGEKGIIVWIEPEKCTFVAEIEKLANKMITRNADMIIPKRQSVTSYPIDQQRFEWLGNYRFQELTGISLDVWFGPRIMNFETAQYFLNYKGEYGDKWDSIFIPILRALYDGKSVIGLKTNYQYPKSQTKEEQGSLDFFNKRRLQLNSLVDAMDKEAKILGLI
jgi:hypothetical protein